MCLWESLPWLQKTGCAFTTPYENKSLRKPDMVTWHAQFFKHRRAIFLLLTSKNVKILTMNCCWYCIFKKRSDDFRNCKNAQLAVIFGKQKRLVELTFGKLTFSKAVTFIWRPRNLFFFFFTTKKKKIHQEKFFFLLKVFFFN